jgi:protein farnesyltransferase subunit beta
VQRAQHADYLRRGLRRLNHHFEALDASKPWLCFWTIHGLYLLNEPIDASVARRQVM